MSSSQFFFDRSTLLLEHFIFIVCVIQYMFCSVILINFWLVGRYFPIMITRFKLDTLFGKVFVCNILLRIVLFLSQIQRIKRKNPLSNAGTSMCIDQYKSVQHDGIHLLSFIVTLLIFNNDKKKYNNKKTN